MRRSRRIFTGTRGKDPSVVPPSGWH